MCGGSQDEADFHQVRFVFILLYNEKNVVEFEIILEKL